MKYFAVLLVVLVSMSAVVVDITSAGCVSTGEYPVYAFSLSLSIVIEVNNIMYIPLSPQPVLVSLAQQLEAVALELVSWTSMLQSF